MAGNKSRQIVFETRKIRNLAIGAILTAQGFSSQLDQYEIVKPLSSDSSNPVWAGVHKLSKQQVAIKAVEEVKYERLTNENQISEVQAMAACESNKNILNLYDSFKQGGKVYIVTKFARGGDLLHYLN